MIATTPVGATGEKNLTAETPAGKGVLIARGPGRSGEKFRIAHFSKERTGPHGSREEVTAY